MPSCWICAPCNLVSAPPWVPLGDILIDVFSSPNGVAGEMGTPHACMAVWVGNDLPILHCVLRNLGASYWSFISSLSVVTADFLRLYLSLLSSALLFVIAVRLLPVYC